MKYIKYLKLCMLGMCVLTTSCAEDWLDTTPTGSAATEEVLGSTENIKQAINGICKLTTMQHAYYGQGFNGEGTIMLMYVDYMGQDFYFPYMAPGWGIMMNGLITQQPARLYTHYPWYYYYTIIGNANTILDNIDNATGDENERKFLKAEALTFRAHAYNMLAQFYCDAWKDSSNGSTNGVVLRLEANMDDLPLSTLAQCYDQIYTDLNEAITLFGESELTRAAVFDNTSVCFPDINMAYAIYARTALNKDDYANALKYAKLAQDDFPLMSVNDYKSGFVAPTSEWIWGSFGASTETLYYWSFQTMMAYNGYYGFNGEITTANRVLIESFPSTDIRKGLFPSEEIFLEDGQAFLDVANASNSEFITENAAGMAAFDKTNAYVKANTTYTASTVYYPYANLKFACTAMPGVGGVPFIRTSEMVLIEAEANYFLGNAAEAQANLNTLNADTGRDPEYSCDATGTELLEEIILYRRLELWGEGHSWLDCKRWKRNVVRPGLTEGGNFHAAVAGTWGADPAFWKWIIPDREVDYNSAIEFK